MLFPGALLPDQVAHHDCVRRFDAVLVQDFFSEVAQNRQESSDVRLDGLEILPRASVEDALGGVDPALLVIEAEVRDGVAALGLVDLENRSGRRPRGLDAGLCLWW